MPVSFSAKLASAPEVMLGGASLTSVTMMATFCAALMLPSEAVTVMS